MIRIALLTSLLKRLRRERTLIKLRRRGSFSTSTNISLFLRPLLDKRLLQPLIGAQLAFGVAVIGTQSLGTDAALIQELTNQAQPMQVLELKLQNTSLGEHSQVNYLPVEDLTGVSQYFAQGHPALDLRAPMHTPVVAMDEGVVSGVYYTTVGYGRYIIVDHDNGLSSMYSHLHTITVEPGERLYAGRRIGTIGMTGWTTGPHLHFEVRQNGMAIDPIKYLKPALEIWRQQQSS